MAVVSRNLTVVVPVHELHVTGLGIGLNLGNGASLGVLPSIVVNLFLALEDTELLQVVSSGDRATYHQSIVRLRTIGVEVGHVVGLYTLIVRTVELHNLVAVQVEHEVRLPTYIVLTVAVDVDRVQSYLNTLVAHLTYVSVSSVETRRIRYRALHQHVGGAAAIDIDSTIESAVEHAEVQTEVVLGNGSPCQVLVTQSAGEVTESRLVVKPCLGGRDSRVGGVSANRTATVLTPRETQLGIVEPSEVVLDEVFLAEYPCTRHTVEVTPLLAFGESRETVTTVVEGYIVLAVEVVVETSQVSS